MSTKVTNTMTIDETSATPPSKLGFSIQILKTKHGILMVLELLISISCLIMCFWGALDFVGVEASEALVTLFLCFFSNAFITLLQLVSCLASPMAASSMPKMAYGVVNNAVSGLFHVVSSAVFLGMVSDIGLSGTTNENIFGVLGITNGVLYIFSSYFSFESFKSP